MNEKDKTSIASAKENQVEGKKVFKKWKQTKPKNLDSNFHNLHDKEFAKMDCLTCANCCKTTSPIFRDADIRRISKHLKVKESQFIEQFLKMDEEQDYVLQKSPCLFLDSDNTCRIYEVRPLACREYPHTNRKNMHQILELTVNNTMICPAVARIVEQLVSK